jgi:sugar-specific transcriptional regulator TrmB
MEEGVFDLLSRAGLTRYESQVYMSLCRRTVDNATALARDSGVPRTKVYQVLESLHSKGWIRVLSGRPLFYRIVEIPEVIDRLQREHEDLLWGLKGTLNTEVRGVMDKVVVMNRSVGLDGLREHLREARTASLSQFTWDLYEGVRGDLEGAELVRVLFWKDESPPAPRPNEEFRISQVKVVHMVRGIEVPAQQAIVDQQRLFTITHEPLAKRYEVDEMFTPDCVGCLMDMFDLGWEASPPAPSAPPPK